MSNTEKSKPSGSWWEYMAVRSAMSLVDLLPLNAAYSLTRFGADIGFRLARRRRSIAVANVLYSGVASTMPDAIKIARGSFRHFARMVVDINKSLVRIDEDVLRERITVSAPEETLSLLADETQGALVLCGHFGNWEVAGQLIAMDRRMMVIAKKAKNERVQAYFDKRQIRPMYEVIEKQGADFRQLARAARGGGVVAMVVDQHARGATGMPLPFFGREAATHVSPAVLYRMSRVPILLCAPIVTGPMKFNIEFSEPLHFDTGGGREEVARRIMTRYNQWLEDVIRRYPEQYLWAHRRWRKS